MSKDVSIIIRFDTKPAADAMQSLLTVVNQTGGKVDEMSASVAQGGAAQQKFAGSSMNARMMLQQLNFGLQDAPMFMTNFRMGMMSVGNNLDMVAQTFIRVRDEARETGKSVSSLVTGALKGPMGILLAVSTLIALLQVLPQLFKSAGEEADKAAEGGLKNFADALKRMSTEAVQATKAQLERLILRERADLAEMQKHPAKEGAASAGGILGLDPNVDKITGERLTFTADQIAAKQKTINDLVEQRKATTDELLGRETEFVSGQINELNAKLKNLQLSRDSAKTDQERVRLNREIEDTEIRIQRLRQEGTEAGKGPAVAGIEIETETDDVSIGDFKGRLPRLQDRLAEIDALMKVEESTERIRSLSVERANVQREINELTETNTQLLDDLQSAVQGGIQTMLNEIMKGSDSEEEFQLRMMQFDQQEKQIREDQRMTDQERHLRLTQLARQRAEYEKSQARSIGSILVAGAQAFGMEMLNVLNRLLAEIAAKAVITFFAKALSLPVPFAKGGIVDKPTLALIGEAGPEAVVPLSRAGAFFPPPQHQQNVNVNVQVSGQLKGDGMSIYGLIKRIERLERKYS